MFNKQQSFWRLVDEVHVSKEGGTYTALVPSSLWSVDFCLCL